MKIADLMKTIIWAYLKARTKNVIAEKLNIRYTTKRVTNFEEFIWNNPRRFIVFIFNLTPKCSPQTLKSATHMDQLAS